MIRLPRNKMPPPNPISTRLKIQLKLSISRLRHVQQKETALAKQQRREIASLLDNQKDESARIRVENIIRQEINVELLEILELYAELLLARIGLIDQRRDCDPGLIEPIKSLIYAAGRTDVKELQQVRDILILKFGKEFARDALENPETSVAPRVFKKLSVDPPSEELVTLYLQEIAKTYRIPWSGLPEEERLKLINAAINDGNENNNNNNNNNDDDNDDNDQPGSGGLIEKGLQLPSVQNAPEKVPISIAPATASSDNPKPVLKFQAQSLLQPQAGSQVSAKASVPNFDELSKRFAALKR
ncbi:regulator of Vps4 activity in the MVB pathway-domain-containing protein [Lipomyces japonicus]|uniref:regulator of Vps4 activity in the MVB pathway-domain-containing protein n=1 Tax=Lipomyces japonicus TaxID=56871 RepID=UPI0034CEF462